MLSILELIYQIKRFDNEDFFLFFIKWEHILNKIKAKWCDLIKFRRNFTYRWTVIIFASLQEDPC